MFTAVIVTQVFAQILEERAQLGADEVARCSLAERLSQRGNLAGEVLGIGERPLGTLTVLLGRDAVTVVLSVLRKKDEGSGV